LGIKLTTWFSLTTLRMNGAVPVLPLYDFRAWTRETFGYGYDLL